MTVTSYHGKPSQSSGLGELDPRDDDGVPLEYITRRGDIRGCWTATARPILEPAPVTAQTFPATRPRRLPGVSAPGVAESHLMIAGPRGHRTPESWRAASAAAEESDQVAGLLGDPVSGQAVGGGRQDHGVGRPGAA